jgi:hypothetical protein
MQRWRVEQLTPVPHRHALRLRIPSLPGECGASMLRATPRAKREEQWTFAPPWPWPPESRL